MSGGSFSVDLDQLDQVVARLAGLAGFLNDTFDGIDRRVKALQSGDWDGVAAQAYAEAHRNWLGEAQEFAQGVADATEAARQAHARYKAAMNVNNKMAQG